MVDAAGIEALIQQQKLDIDRQNQQLNQRSNNSPDYGAGLAALADMMGDGSNKHLKQYKMLSELGGNQGGDNLKKQALQQQLMQQKQGLVGKQMALLKLMNKQQSGANLSLTPGEKKRDQTFAKEASDWDASGGYANFAGNLDRLKNASAELGKEGDLSNTLMPKMIRDVIDPESSKLQEDVEFVAQQSLKQILGGQFSEKEGENLIRRTYNPRLPDEVNQRKLDTLIKQMDTQAKAKDRAIKYFNQHGTLKGFEGSSATSLSGFEKEMKDNILGTESAGKKSRLEELRKKAGF